MPPGKMNAELEHAAQSHVIPSTPSVRDNDLEPYVEYELPATGNDVEYESMDGPTPSTQNNDLGPYEEHEMPATSNDAEYEHLQERKQQPGKFSTDLYHMTSRDIVSENTTSILTLEKEIPSPATDEDCYSPSQSQIRQFRKLNSFLGIDDDCPTNKPVEFSQSDTAKEASGDWEMFDFELDERKPQDNISTGLPELECTSISNVSNPLEMPRDISQILRPGTPLPIELGSGKPMSHEVIMEEAEMFSSPEDTPNELFLPFHESSRILWSQSQPQQSKLKGYIASIRERHAIPYKTYKKPDSRPNLVLECPKEITLTIATPMSSPVESTSQLVDQGLLMPPPNLYKKRQRHRKLIADSIYVKELRVRRLSHMDISDEEFAARRDSIMQKVIVVFGD